MVISIPGMEEQDLSLTFSQYTSELNKTLKEIDAERINSLIQCMKIAIIESRKIIFMGNGGSAANSIHIAGDFMKTFALMGFKPRISTPFDNLCFLTAASNDLDYNDSFDLYLKAVIEENSIIIFLSGSGNSLNLIKCCKGKFIQSVKGTDTWSISAYSGGEISKLTNNWIHLPTMNMEIAEDIQIITFHYIKQSIYNSLIKYNRESKILGNERYYKRTMLNEVS